MVKNITAGNHGFIGLNPQYIVRDNISNPYPYILFFIIVHRDRSLRLLAILITYPNLQQLPLTANALENVATTKSCLSWQLVDVNFDGTFGHP